MAADAAQAAARPAAGAPARIPPRGALLACATATPHSIHSSLPLDKLCAALRWVRQRRRTLQPRMRRRSRAALLRRSRPPPLPSRNGKMSAVFEILERYATFLGKRHGGQSV